MPLNSNFNLRRITVLMAVALIALLIGGVWFYRLQEQVMQQKVADDLIAIGQLKADQIAAWRKDQLADAAFLQLHPFLSTIILRFITEESEENKRELHVRLRSLADQHGYADMLLVTPGGKPLLSLVESLEGHRGYLPALAEALRDRKPAFTELHFESPGASPHISVVVPLYKANGPGTEPFSALVLRNDASQFLYPLVQFWPTPSETAETLLVRQDGDEVLFLNDLRHQPNTALKLRIPLSRTDVPAVMAVLGRQGVFQGKDYRGADVVSVILSIPNSPWFMIAKIDAAEAFAEWRFQSVLMLVLIFGLMAFIGTAGLVLWQRDKKAQFRALYLSEAARRATVERHSITLKAIGDAVIATDARSNVELLNPVAEALTGWTNAEARGRPLEEVFRIVNEDTGKKVEDPVVKVLREGVVVGLANHTLLISRDGTGRPIADSGAPIRDDEGRIIGVVLVFRDQTQERAATAKLAERERYYRSLLFNLHEDILVIDRDYRITDINNTALQTLGLTHAEVVGRKCHEISHGLDSPCHEHGEQCALVEVFTTGKPSSCRHDHIRSDGTRAYIDILMSPLTNEDGAVTHVIEAVRDITAVIETREALRQSEERFRAIFESMALGCCLDEIVYSNGQTVDYRILDVNPAYERLIGISRDRAAGALASGLYGTGQAPNMEIYSKVDATGEPASFEAFFESTGRHLQITASRIAPGRFCTLFSDATECKRAEKALQESEEKFRTLFENAPLGYQSLDANGDFIELNETWCKILGYTKEEVLGRNFSEFIHPDFREIFKENFPKFKSMGYILGVEFEMIKMDGSEIIVSFDGKIGYKDDGSFNQTHCVLSDITERKRAEAERGRLMLAIGQAGEAIVITDCDAIIQYVNPAFEAITGYTHEEAIGRNPRILKSGEQDEAFYLTMWEKLTRGETWRGRLVNKKKDGELFTEEAVISPVRNEAGQTVNYVAVKRDITEHLKLEAQFQQAQKMESVGRLAGGVAHDYNNMLSVIMGFTELALQKTAPDDPLHEDLAEILSAARRSADITRQLLAFARRQTIDPQAIDLNEAVEKMLKMLRRLIGEDIDMAWRPGPGRMPVFMDPSQLDQLLANLCANARDAIADVGRLTIETGHVRFDADYCADHAGFILGDFILLAVSDDGCGMDKDTLDKIFEPFFTTKGVGRGTGLGLATVFGIVKQNDGFINVYSEPGRGTTFKIYLPPHAGEDAGIKAQETTEISAGHGETVLVVEDEAPVLKLARKILAGLGYTVLTAATPDEALAAAEANLSACGDAQAGAGNIHLLITDVVMPEMNGRELAEHLQTHYPDLKVLFMSGYTANVIAHRGVLDEGVHFIQKPFSRKDLAAKVKALLG
jgi:PAS domain S-box-containing protein